MMSDHYMEVSLDRDWLRMTPHCRAEHDAPCRLTCDKCEEWETPTKLSDGWWHTSEEGIPHKMHDMGECNVVLYLEDCPEELCTIANGFKIAEFDITPVWAGEGYEWTPEAADE